MIQNNLFGSLSSQIIFSPTQVKNTEIKKICYQMVLFGWVNEKISIIISNLSSVVHCLANVN